MVERRPSNPIELSLDLPDHHVVRCQNVAGRNYHSSMEFWDVFRSTLSHPWHFNAVASMP